jgi:hypothetical protein
MKYNSLTVAFSSRKIDPYYVDLLKATSGVYNIEIIPFDNPNGTSLTKLYNEALEKATNDIVLFCHDDLKFDKKNWGRKLLNHFNRQKDYGIIGIAGTRYLSKTGKWWEDWSKMHGAVNHESGGKKWLTRYSKDIGNHLDEVVLVDGLFFAVNKKNIKKRFNDSINGFHFYDIDFCFRNYLERVKIGVCTDIRVTHLSVGETNEEWEENRKTFAKKWDQELPVKIDKKLRKNEKLEILIGCLNFNDFTGSEVHVYELAKGLIKEGHNVTICSNIGGEISKKAKSFGVKLCDINEPPGFTKGDGTSQIQGPEGPMIMQENQVYKVKDVKFDIMHLHHKPITERLLQFFPLTPCVTTIHSEVIDLEHPVIDERIKGYICIRPEIRQFIKRNFNIDDSKSSVIYNPFDCDRFKTYPLPQTEKERVLFVGTIDYIRKEAILDLIKETKENNQELWLVGKKRDPFLDDVKESHVKYFGPTWKVEEYIKQTHKTAGILLGRTTIEGWLCGRPGLIYQVDENGTIASKKWHDVPEDIEKFSSKNVINKIIKKYTEIL